VPLRVTERRCMNSRRTSSRNRLKATYVDRRIYKLLHAGASGTTVKPQRARVRRTQAWSICFICRSNLCCWARRRIAMPRSPEKLSIIESIYDYKRRYDILWRSVYLYSPYFPVTLSRRVLQSATSQTAQHLGTLYHRQRRFSTCHISC
jgi:hypothetical protein